MLDKVSAAQVLSLFDERKLWGRLLSSEDDRVVLDAVKFLVVMRDGKPVQQINVSSVNVSVTAEDIAKARAIAQSLGQRQALCDAKPAPEAEVSKHLLSGIRLEGDDGGKKDGNG